MVGLVASGPEVETFVLGKMAFDGPDMRRDTIFRIASMTKPVTATAVMMLVEEGKLRLDEPVDRRLPELANRRVLRRIDAALDDTVPARRPITVEDLLTFRCGHGLILAPPGRCPIQKAIADLGIFGPPDRALPLEGDAWMQRLSGLPLLAQPGEDWLYGTGSNIQGALVARASGQSLSRLCEERIFRPLGMKDTAYFVPPAKIERLLPAYGSEGDRLVLFDEPTTGKWSRPPTFEHGAAGLVSTVDDYLAFARMLLADGRHRGQPLLTPASAKAMKTNHLTASQRVACFNRRSAAPTTSRPSRGSHDDGAAQPAAAASVRVRKGRIEVDGVAGFKRMLLTVDVDAQGALDHVDELDARMVVRP
jgi:CubicO group peptidase (beta-lactamase class C family)